MSRDLARTSEPRCSTTSELDERLNDAYDENGVDRSQTPTERVMSVEESLNALASLRRICPPR